MKERPILFSAPMVRAIRAGTKTQTRRVVRGSDDAHDIEPRGDAWIMHGDRPTNYDGDVQMNDWRKRIRCPYGAPHDRLWVRESWGEYVRAPGAYAYRADDPLALNRWRPSIHMPRAASRIMLEVLDVRVERLHEISAADIIAEGAVARPHVDRFGRNPVSAFDGRVYLDLRSLWRAGWESINGPGSWAANPFVWRVVFRWGP